MDDLSPELLEKNLKNPDPPQSSSKSQYLTPLLLTISLVFILIFHNGQLNNENSNSQVIYRLKAFPANRSEAVALTQTQSSSTRNLLKYDYLKKYGQSLKITDYPDYVPSIIYQEKIPFYVYTNHSQYLTCLPAAKKAFAQWSDYFHGDDVIWNKLILEHPWRVLDPEQAKIFIVPALINFRADRRKVRCGSNPSLDQHSLMDSMAKYIISTEHYQKNNGIDHLIVSSHFKIRNNPKWKLFSSDFSKMLKNMTFGNFEIKDNANYNFGRYRKWFAQWRCSIVVPYVDYSKMTSQYTSIENQEIIEKEQMTFESWKNRHYSFLFMGGLDGRRSYFTRRNLNWKCKEGFFSSAINGRTKQPFNHNYIYAASSWKKASVSGGNCNETQCLTRCHNCILTQNLKKNYTNFLMDSKFALVVHGDTPSTSRLYDAISSGSLPIIISSDLYEQALPFISNVPWFDFAFFISQGEDTVEIAEQIRNIITFTPEYLLRHKFEMMRAHVRDVSWKHRQTRIVENVLYDATHGCRL